MGKSMVSCRLSLKSTHWNIQKATFFGQALCARWQITRSWSWFFARRRLLGDWGSWKPLRSNEWNHWSRTILVLLSYIYNYIYIHTAIVCINMQYCITYIYIYIYVYVYRLDILHEYWKWPLIVDISRIQIDSIRFFCFAMSVYRRM